LSYAPTDIGQFSTH